MSPRTTLVFALLAPMFLARAATAQDPPPSPGGASPDAKPLVATLEAPKDAPAIERSAVDATTVSIAAGGSWATGNTQSLQGTVNGVFDKRAGDNEVAAAVLGNYGQAGKPDMVVAAENVQGKLRYDRFLTEGLSGFLLTTGRHDRFQGLDFRLNVDPGVRYILLRDASYALWGEGGYDLQHDIRRKADLVVYEDPTTKFVPKLDPATGAVIRLPRTYTDHSGRLFAGYRHAFNKEVTLQTGLEYLQSFRDADRLRLNFDALTAAKLFSGFALGVAVGARYDHAPLPGKETLDTLATVNLIYGYSDLPEKANACEK